MRASGLSRRIVKMLVALMAIIPRAALNGANLAPVSKVPDTSIRNVISEPDPDENGDCSSLGELDIVFRTDNSGPPNVGVVLTDPRGRRFGFYPLTNQVWQALPVALGYIDCVDLGSADGCRGVIQICGPVSGNYKLEVIASQPTIYSVGISARSKEVHNGHSIQSLHSEADLSKVTIRERSRDIVFLNYSRDPQEQVTAQLQHPLQAQRDDARFHREGNVKVRKERATTLESGTPN